MEAHSANRRLIQHIGSHPNLRQLIWTFSPLEDLLKWTCVSQDVFKEIVRVCYHTFPLHLRSSRVEGSSNVVSERRVFPAQGIS